jgi:signal transduction histidine kinase
VNEVSCKVFEILMAPLQAKGVTDDQLVAGTDIEPSHLRNKKARIHWGQYVAIMRNVRPHFTDDEYRELGRSYMRSPGLKFAFVIARLLFSPLDIYRWFSKPREGVGNQMFTCIVPSHREITKNEIELDLTLPEGFEISWDFFVISAGNMEELPRLFGLPRAELALSSIPRGARMHIVIPTGKAPFFARIWRFLARPFSGRTAARELKEAHETLIVRFAELEDARQKVDRQAARLRTAHTVNDLVQRDVDIERMLATIANVLVAEAGFEWAKITLSAIDGADAQSAEFGAEHHDPPIKRILEARGGQQVGEVSVAAKRGAQLAEREDLLAFITPALAIALQNAIYRTGLERLVDVRTTELRQARDQLEGTVVQLRDAQGARERFFGNISHEIRTPLSIILLAAADIDKRSGTLLDERAKANLGSVTDSARKLVRLVDELLLLAAGQENKLTTKPEPTDLAALVRNLFAAWRPGAEVAGLQLMATVPERLIAFVDPVALERVVSNLLSNAVKYTPRGGRVELQLAADAEAIRISVIDTGEGISADLASRLFGRFERADGADRTISGTGLGLAVAKQLAEVHGGTITHHPRDGGGTEMRVVLPIALLRSDAKVAAPTLRLVDATKPAPAPSVSRVGPEGLALGTIVLAEDDARLADMIAELLSDEYIVYVGNDGAAALELVKLHQPQLLITDVDMPNMDGIELSRRFHEITNEKLAPIIILSAMLDLGTRLAGLEAGAIDYVTKPFDPLELKARVRAQFRMRELAVRLHRAEQLSTLGVLTSGLAHELRNPANGVVNAIAPIRALLPAELTAGDAPVGQLLDVMAECAAQINVLSKQLLGFRNDSTELDLRPTRVSVLVQRALSLTRLTCTGVEIRVDVEAEAVVNCAPPLMLQVLTNLIENAAYAAGKAGWVEITARVAAGRMLLEIGDSGPGVPVHLRSTVFEPFFTTKPQGVGTGLGLPLSREIVTRHRGILEIRERGPRPVFVVELPVHSALDVAAGAG